MPVFLDRCAAGKRGDGRNGAGMTADGAETGQQTALRRRRLRPVHALRGLWLLAMLPLVFAVVAGVSLLGQEVTAPTWLKSRVEAQAAAVLDGGALRFGEITVWLGRDLHPRVRMTDAVLRDRTGAVLARVPLIEARLSPRGLLLARAVLPQEIVLTGAEVGVRRNADGTVAVALGGAMREGQAPGLAALLDGFDRLFERPGLNALETVRIEGLVVNYADARAGRAWTLDGGRLALDLTGGVTRLTADLALLSGRAFVTTLSFAYESPRGLREARFRLDVADAAAADIASQSPALSWLGVLDAPISARIVSGLDAAGALGEFRAELDIGAGALAPVAGALPVRFEAARARLTFDPARGHIRFDDLGFNSDWASVAATGQAMLQGPAGGWPDSIVGQFRLTEARLNPGGVYPEAIALPDTLADMRLQLQPFVLDVGQVAIAPSADGAIGAAGLAGRIAAAPEGWTVALDARLDRLAVDRLAQLWPAALEPRTRDWVSAHVTGGEIRNVVLGLRAAPGQAPQVAFTHEFGGTTIIALRGPPPLTGVAGHVAFGPQGFAVTLTDGRVTPPEGGALDLAGTAFVIGPGPAPAPARLDLRAAGPITAALSLLNQPPFGYPDRAGLPVALAEGAARIEGRFDFPLRNPLPPGAVAFEVAARLSGVESDVLIPGRSLSADMLDLRATAAGMTIAGDARVGAVPVTATFTTGFGPAAAAPAVEGRVGLSQGFLDEFRIALPPGFLRGQGEAVFRLDLPRGQAPAFRLDSDLRGLGLSLPALGWSKAPATGGTLALAGRLGPAPVIEEVTLDAAGLDARGRITLAPGGTLEVAAFDRLRLGGWLDAGVRLVGRGEGAAPRIEITGGSLDLRRADFGTGGEGGGQGGPMTVRLDRLQVTEGIALTGFAGDFATRDGLTGDFSATVNGGAPITGSVVPMQGRTAVRLLSDRAGEVLAAAGFLQNAEGGTLDLTLLPAGGEGTFDGYLSIATIRVREAPALASILNAVSVVGLIQQMAGQGLVFDEVLAEFRITPDRIVVSRSSAVGAGLGISLDGIYTMADSNMDFQGVVSPFYIINAVGSVLTRRGEGLIGFNFTLRGPLGAAQVVVNPLSAFTPGMFREIFRRPAPVFEE